MATVNHSCTKQCANPYQRQNKLRAACPIKKGITEELVRAIWARKKEPTWMLKIRLKGLEYFQKQSLPTWGPPLKKLDTNDLLYYTEPTMHVTSSWDQVPKPLNQLFSNLKVKKAEKHYLAGLGTQYESEMVYHNLQKKWAELGIIFLDTDTALQRYPELFKKYFAHIVPYNDNKFAALNTAAWSGGSFIYVPKGVRIEQPLQTYFWINNKKMGQFERTLIIADENSYLHYIEGCTSQPKSTHCLHASVVEVVAKRGAHIRYSTIQNWAPTIHTLATKRAHVYQDAFIEWIDGNVGSHITMKYPAVVLKEPGARTEITSVSTANYLGQIQDTGSKAIHKASNTTSRIIAKSISKNGGISSHRSVIKIAANAKNCKAFAQCDSLILDQNSQANAYPYVQANNATSQACHEAHVSSITQEHLIYLMSRGISKDEAQTLIINNFIEPFTKELPFEYALEFNRLLTMHTQKSID